MCALALVVRALLPFRAAIGINVKTLIAHRPAPHHLVREVVEQGKDQAVDESNRHLGASRWQTRKHARREKNEQQCREQGHGDIHCILYLTKRFSSV